MAGPVSPGTNYGRPGFDESTAFLVEGIEAEDFAQFLWIFYNPYALSILSSRQLSEAVYNRINHRLHDIYDTSLGNWEIILKLANQWECERVREVAVEHIDRLPGVTDIHKIKIYRDNDVPRRFLIPLYIALARRERRLERREFQCLDNEDLYYIVTAREMLRAPLPPPGGRGGTNRLASPMRRDVSEEEIFATAFGMTVEEIQAIMSPGRFSLMFSVAISL